MDAPVGVALLGTRHAHAAGKMAVLRAADKWKVIGACEPDDEARAARMQESLYRDVAWLAEEELLAHPEVQVVAVEGEVFENLAFARRSIEAGKHIHFDKPAGSCLAEFAAIVEEATEAGLIIQMGYMFRYNPAFCFVFRAKEEGWLGDIFSVRGRMSTSIPSAETRERLARYPGGMMFELGCHLLDAVVHLLGSPTDVQGHLRHDAAFADDLADNTVAVFHFEKAMATLEVAAMEVEPFPRRRFEVYGTQGSIVIEPLEPPQVVACFASPPEGHPSGWHSVEMPEYRRYEDDLDELADCVREGRPLSYTGDHDLAVQRALLQASGVAV